MHPPEFIGMMIRPVGTAHPYVPGVGSENKRLIRESLPVEFVVVKMELLVFFGK